MTLSATAIAAALDRVDRRLTPDRILMGNVVQAGNGQNPARAASTTAAA